MLSISNETKRKPGRPVASIKDNTRRFASKIRWTEAEYELVTSAASVAVEDVSNFIRSAVMFAIKGHAPVSRMDLTVGDVVQLRSGGDAMTVTLIDGTDISVAWNSGSKIQCDMFPVDALKLVKPETHVKSPKAKKEKVAPIEEAVLV
jgi:uncharacterized protein YodC (DUF2158 family)